MYNNFLQVQPETFSGIVAKCPIGASVEAILVQASLERRITVGLLPAIEYLSKNCNGAIFCFTTNAPPGDSATHIQDVLLQAFCDENEIYVIKVDSKQKLEQILGASNKGSNDYSCVLVHNPYMDPYKDSQELDINNLSTPERDIIEHCEKYWGYETPVVKLPEK